MDPELKAFLNTLKCPLCDGQIEGTKVCYCAYNREHYSFYCDWDTRHNIDYETVIIYEGRHKYDITQYHPPFYHEITVITIYNIDAEYRVIEKKNGEKKTPPFTFDKKLFNFSQTTREKIVNRVKTILVFQ